MAAAAIGGTLILLRYDVVALDLAVYAVYLGTTVVLPGVFTWRLLLRRLHTDDGRQPTGLEDLALGSILGFGVQLPVYLVGVCVGVPLLFLVLPVIVLVVSVTRFGRDIWTLPTGKVPPQASWALAALIVYGLAWLGRNAFNRRPLSLRPAQSPSIDETFHQALVSELSMRVPPEVPFLLDSPLDYHWFVHAQMAAAGHFTGISSVVLIRELMPAIALVLAVLGLGAVALRLTGRPIAAVIAPALLVAGVFHLMGPHYASWHFTEPFLSKRYVSSPSHPYGLMMSMPALMLLLEVLDPARKAGRHVWIALTVALLALSGAKATFIPIFLCGAAGVWLFYAVFLRRINGTATGLVGLLVAVAAFAQFVLFGGQTGSMAVDPFETVWSALRQQHMAQSPRAFIGLTVAMLMGWLLYGVGVVGLLTRGRWRDPRLLWMSVAILAGVTVPFVFYRTGLSQLWFQRSVAELLVLGSAWGMACLLPNPLTRRHVLLYSGLAGASGLAAFGTALYLESTRRVDNYARAETVILTVATPFLIVAGFLLVRWVLGTTRFRRPGIAIVLTIILGLGASNVAALVYDTATRQPVVSPKVNYLFAKGGVRAARFIARRSSSPYDIVATNVHCVRPTADRCDNRNFWVSAYTERRIVVEGWGYTAMTNASYVPDEANKWLPVPYPERLAINDAAFTDPSVESVGRLVDTYDVRWLFVSKKYPADLRGLSALDGVLDKRFHNKNYTVFEVS
ncbi:MAG: hypothetical protein GEU93_07115 [Propionibacteriales bacterium]|nr:hypothetical protein [Propionibacteriales bacterium]